MSWWRRLSVPIFAVISSCGDAPEVPADTPAVASTPHDFVVFDTSAGTLVYDAARDASFVLDGHPVRDRAIELFDPWAEVGFLADRADRRSIVSADGRTLLLRDDGGVAAVDLARGGAVLARAPGEARGASVAPDGRTFAAIATETITVVDVASGAATVVASQTLGGPPELTWDDDTIAWVDDSVGAHLFDRRALRDVAVALDGAHLFARHGRFVIWNEHEVQVWRGGASAPETRTASAHVGQVVADEAVARVAWVEHDIDAEHDRVWLHTLDVAANVHLRFPSKATPCSLGSERLEAITATELVTDEECTTGCPSFPSEPSLVAYDFASGAFTRRWAGPVTPPYTDELAARMAEAERIANAFGLSRETTTELPLRRHPSLDRVLAPSARGLRIAAHDGSTLVDLDGSDGFTVADVVFADGGARLVASAPARVALWDATTGRRLFHAALPSAAPARPPL